MTRKRDDYLMIRLPKREKDLLRRFARDFRCVEQRNGRGMSAYLRYLICQHVAGLSATGGRNGRRP